MNDVRVVVTDTCAPVSISYFTFGKGKNHSLYTIYTCTKNSAHAGSRIPNEPIVKLLFCMDVNIQHCQQIQCHTNIYENLNVSIDFEWSILIVRSNRYYMNPLNILNCFNIFHWNTKDSDKHTNIVFQCMIFVVLNVLHAFCEIIM